MTDEEIARTMQDAQLAERGGRFDVAAELYDQIVNAAPRFSPAHFFKGMLHIQQGDLGKGRSLLARAIELAPDEPIYRLHFSAVLRNLVDVEAAIPHAQKSC